MKNLLPIQIKDGEPAAKPQIPDRGVEKKLLVDPEEDAKTEVKQRKLEEFMALNTSVKDHPLPEPAPHCSICLDILTETATCRLNQCNHWLHEACCKELVMQNAPSSSLWLACPICTTIHGTRTGNQPLNGKMSCCVDSRSLAGFPGCGTIQLDFQFKAGTQENGHPSPGRLYRVTGFPRSSFLPNNELGQQLAAMLKLAFERRLLFTVGTSSTTGRADTLTFNDIHLKTSKDGQYGYPDPTYLGRLTKELANFGIHPFCGSVQEGAVGGIVEAGNMSIPKHVERRPLTHTTDIKSSEVIIPMSNNWIPRKLQHLRQKLRNGEVRMIDAAKGFGFIEVPSERKKGYYFRVENVKNFANIDVRLMSGSSVMFAGDIVVDDPKCLRADLVLVNPPEQAKKPHQEGWLIGEIKTICETMFFVKVDREIVVKDVFVHKDKISKFLLPLRIGDHVEFVLAARNPGKPSAHKARPLEYRSRRTSLEVDDFFLSFYKAMDSKESSLALSEALSTLSLWLYLVKEADEKPDIMMKFGLFLTVVIKKGRYHRALLRAMLTEIITTTFATSMLIASESAYQCQIMLGEMASSVSKMLETFCCLVADLVPDLTSALMPLVLGQIHLLLKDGDVKSSVLNLFTTFVMPNQRSDEDEVGRSTPNIVPNSKQMAANDFNGVAALSPVKVGEPYSNEDDYLDTYYRLMWAEAFSKIQEGVQDFVHGKLDARNMDVYLNVSLAGLCQDMSRTIALPLKFRPARKIKNWKVSPKLMFGNLLAISASQRFDDIIWATVCDRDDEMLEKHSIIYVTLIEDNSLPQGDLIRKLVQFSGLMVMAESPTFYQSTQPILRSLRQINMEDYKLGQEIITARPVNQDPPTYIEAFKQDEVYARLIPTLTKTLDDSQQEAFMHALSHKVAVIQGPPGCGKTYIGAKLAELILAAKLDRPILVLTYKNHALDEFLKQMLPLCGGKEGLIRIGGRSLEPELNDCNLNVVARNSKLYGLVQDEIWEKKTEIDVVSQRLQNAIQSFTKTTLLSCDDVLTSLEEWQLVSLLVDWDWSGIRFKKKTFAGKPMVASMMNDAINSHVSIRNFCSKYLYTRDSKQSLKKHQKVSFTDVEHNLFSLLRVALKHWLPTRDEIRKMRDIHSPFRQLLIDTEMEAGQEEDLNNVNGNADAYDEDMIRELQEGRLVNTRSSSGRDGEGRKKNIVNLFADIGHSTRGYQLSDFPDGMIIPKGQQVVSVIWDLPPVSRMQILYALLVTSSTTHGEEVNQLVGELCQLQLQKQDLEIEKKLKAALRAKVVGATTTGAAINVQLIQRLKPPVVIVEEAAEILEPGLIAALSSATEHLILIGDHKQLRPQVTNYRLRTDYGFDLSLMERLIKSDYPYKTLSTQSRMRPEFSSLLLDIYPKLLDNSNVVDQNEALGCIAKSLFFWGHDHKETGGKKQDDGPEKSRSKTNDAEAEMVVALALFMLRNGVKVDEVTILVAYLGQKKVIRQKLIDAKNMMPDLFKSSDTIIACHTIDMFQVGPTYTI